MRGVLRFVPGEHNAIARIITASNSHAEERLQHASPGGILNTAKDAVARLHRCVGVIENDPWMVLTVSQGLAVTCPYQLSTVNVEASPAILGYFV